MSPAKKTGDRTTVPQQTGKTTTAGAATATADERFVLLSRLGGGGQSEVYRAKDNELGRFVAVKYLNRRSAAAEERMRREARLLAQLRHPAICPIYDIGTHPSRGVFLVLELLEGGTLRELIERGSLSAARVAGIVRDVAVALQVAHAAKVLHRDVKPENIAVLPDGSIKLFDFGIATVANTSKLTGRDRIGTPGYMSPEQFAGDPVDVASDVFSLGCVLYELLTGNLPFASGVDLMRGRYRPLSPAIASHVGQAAVDLLGRMLDVDQPARPTSEEVVTVLTAVERRLTRQQKDAAGEGTHAAEFILSIPADGALPVALQQLADRHDMPVEEAAAVLRIPMMFGAVTSSVDASTGELLVGAKSEVGRFFLKSLSLYLRHGLSLIDEWARRETTSGAEGTRLIGVDFLYAMERRRVFRYGIAEPIRYERPSQIVIKAFCSVRKQPVYLTQYDRFAQQYQLIGGRAEGNENPTETMQRELAEELPLNVLRPGVDYELDVIAQDLVVTQLSPTLGAFTEYRFSIFTAQFAQPLILGEHDRWVTEEELFLGTLADGSRMPWNDHVARVANSLPRGLDSLPFSFSTAVKSIAD